MCRYTSIYTGIQRMHNKNIFMYTWIPKHKKSVHKCLVAVWPLNWVNSNQSHEMLIRRRKIAQINIFHIADKFFVREKFSCLEICISFITVSWLCMAYTNIYTLHKHFLQLLLILPLRIPLEYKFTRLKIVLLICKCKYYIHISTKCNCEEWKLLQTLHI